jgi:hypothetical protein
MEPEITFFTFFSWLVNVEHKELADLSTDLESLKVIYPFEYNRCKHYLRGNKIND